MVHADDRGRVGAGGIATIGHAPGGGEQLQFYPGTCGAWGRV